MLIPKKERALIKMLTLLTTFTLLGAIIPAKATSLIITLETNKPAYGTGETVIVSGNLTLEGYGFRVGLVAVEIDSPLGSYVYRTMQTGPIEQEWIVETTDVYPCFQNGTRTYTFQRGGNAYIKVEMINNSNISRPVAVALYIQYSNNVPFLATCDLINLPAYTSGSVTSSIPIPSDAPTGTTIVYASLYTDKPKYGGLPYCPEANTTFTITSGTLQTLESSTSTPSTSQSVSSFDFNFTIPRSGYIFGNYTIYASSQWQNYTAFSSKTFEVVLVGDVDGNGVVDMTDIGIAALAYASYPGHPKWDPRADINKDGIVDMSDIGIICLHYGEKR